MKEDVITHFITMLSFRDENEKEMGLNGILSLVTTENRRCIQESGGLLFKLNCLSSHSRESIKQAALRLLARLTDTAETSTSNANAAATLGKHNLHGQLPFSHLVHKNGLSTL